MEDKGVFGKIIAILPGLALMVGTLWVLRTWVEPGMANPVLFGQ